MDNNINDKLRTQAEKYLSDIRLFRYHEIGSKNFIQMYALNMDVSEKLLSMISFFEIIYRNKVHNILSTQLASDYLTNANLKIFNELESRQVKKAYARTKSKIKESKVITYLTLGFWCGFLKKNKLWCKYLYKLFSKERRMSTSIRSIIQKTELILKIRNKISHHERIISKSGISISEAMNTITDLTLWLIEKEDVDFYIYVETYFQDKTQEIKNLLRITKER